jgi:hypothetical protein
MNLVDIPSTRLCSTWRNKRVGDERIEKILDRFLISESLVEDGNPKCQWVGSGGISDHSPYFLN